MKKIIPMVALAGLALTSCGGDNNKSKVTPDPLAQTLTLSGQVKNTMPTFTSNLPLKTYFWGDALTVGTITPTGSVSASITPANINSVAKKSLSDWNSDWPADCNASGLKIVDTQYFTPGRFHYYIDNQDYYVVPRKVVDNGNGTSTYTVYYFWYAMKTGGITGHLICGEYDDVYDINLKPGWNIVAETYTYTDATDKYSNSKLTTISQDTSYNDSWTTFKVK